MCDTCSVWKLPYLAEGPLDRRVAQLLLVAQARDLRVRCRQLAVQLSALLRQAQQLRLCMWTTDCEKRSDVLSSAAAVSHTQTDSQKSRLSWLRHG